MMRPISFDGEIEEDYFDEEIGDGLGRGVGVGRAWGRGSLNISNQDRCDGICVWRTAGR